MAIGNYGKALNYENLDDYIWTDPKKWFDYFYDNWDEYSYIFYMQPGTVHIGFAKLSWVKNYEVFDDHITITFSQHLHVWDNLGYNTWSNRTYDFYFNNVTGGTNLKWYKFTDFNNGALLYNLKPCKLTVLNNGEGQITYQSSQITYGNIYYKGQDVTLIYNNDNNDFKCWYDEINHEVLSRELSYSFNITENRNITLVANNGNIGEISRDREFKKILWPKTKVEAITDEDENTLESILNNLNVKQASGFDEEKTQVLKNVNGTLTWVDSI